ncbi:hypothetical protein H0X06_06755 [Candidatus Dependentiae bacterium]|nr:hypothetical protein [Candidatus Dependentiae bacterium]
MNNRFFAIALLLVGAVSFSNAEITPQKPIVQLKNVGTVPLNPYLRVRYTHTDGLVTISTIDIETLIPEQTTVIEIAPGKAGDDTTIYPVTVASLEIITIGCKDSFVQEGKWKNDSFTLSESGIISEENLN